MNYELDPDSRDVQPERLMNTLAEESLAALAQTGQQVKNKCIAAGDRHVRAASRLRNQACNGRELSAGHSKAR